MWLRYLIVSFFKWLVNLFAVSLLFMYVLPSTWGGYALSFPAWIVSFIVAFACAELAFGKELPGKRETLRLLAVWMVVSLTLQILYAWFFFGTVSPVVRSLDVYVQYVLEIFAIVLAAYLTRRRKIKWELGEGMED
jgi:hypothetical protein